MTIQINEANALQAFKNADEKGKALLSDLIGKEVFNRKITDRVTSFETACEVVALSAILPNLSGAPGYLRPSLTAHYKLVIIAEALNEGWKPNWSNSDEYKYWPYFDMGSGFSFYYVYYYYQHSNLGSRLCFRSRELAEYAGTQFLDLYREYFVIE